MEKLKFKNIHMKCWIFFALICISSFKVVADTRKVITGSNVIGDEIAIDTIINQDAVIAPFNDITNIVGITVNTSIVPCTNKKYLVRILLQEQTGREYLILESYREINDADTIVYDNYGMETSYMSPMNPVSIKIYVEDACLTISTINVVSNGAQARGLLDQDLQDVQDSIKYKQVEEIAKSINDYNIKHKKLWWAGVTPLSLRSFEERKRILGMTDSASTGGLEYYEGGIFEIGEPEENTSVRTIVEDSPYVSKFDWRNRHGKNWMTPAKDQGGSGYCVPFTIAGTTEALVNLYYNDLINLDLSEQNLAACARSTREPYIYGMSYKNVLEYMRDYGAYDEECYPFVDAPNAICLRDEKTPNEHVRIAGFNYIGSTADDYIKKALIEKGPLVSGFNTESPPYNRYIVRHAVTLVGYKDIEVGDSIWEIVEYDTVQHSYGLRPQFAIEEDDPRAGMTCWVFKDSYSKSRTYENGYIYMLFHNPTFLNDTYSLNYPFTILNADNYEVICEDADGDGYFWWGLGPKPSDIPSWAQEEPDGDDSNPQYGPMNEYGYIETISLLCPDIVVNTTTTWNEESYLYNNVRVVSGGILTITSNILKHPGSSITVESGGKLIVNGGIITRGNIVVKDNGELLITGGGEIRLSGSNNFNVEQGGIFNQSFGKIIIIG